ncbi:15163_t:CDS:1, partial [Racocetra fulgida]
ILQHGSTNVDRNRLMPFVSVLVDFLVVCCWWWTVEQYMWKQVHKNEGVHDVNVKMMGFDVGKVRDNVVVVDGEVNDEILTRNRDSLNDSCEMWLEKVQKFRGV